MALNINTNITSLVAQRNLSSTQGSMTTSMARLSSGLRVNSAKDDAAGLAIAERMTSQVRGMNVGMRNANDGISLAQTAEGALGKTADILQRMRELAVEVKRVFESTTFNSRKMLGADAGDLEFQVGASTDADNRITIATKNMPAEQKIAEVIGGTVPGTPPTTYTTATITDSTPVADTAGDIRAVIDLIDKSIDFVSAERSVLGASQSRFEVAISYLQISSENQSASRSRIMDADFAQETANLARSQILSQAGSAMLAQANQMPQSVLSLLKG